MDKKEENKVLIRPAYRSEWKEAMDIAWKTFLKFEKKRLYSPRDQELLSIYYRSYFGENVLYGRVSAFWCL